MNKLNTKKRRKANRVPILVVEDNADQWLIIRSALSQCFPEVEPIWVNNAALTLKYLENCTQDDGRLPQLILLDLYLPNREDSWDLLESIKTHPVYRQVPIIMLSYSQDHNDILKSYAFSIASYIVKPVSYHQWLTCFYTLRRYWWESVSLPIHTLQTT